MPDVDAFGKTTVSQCGGERNERSEAIYRTVSRRLRLRKMPIAWKTEALWGCPSIFKKALDILQENAANVIVKTYIHAHEGIWTRANVHMWMLTNVNANKLKSMQIKNWFYIHWCAMLSYTVFSWRLSLMMNVIARKYIIIITEIFNLLFYIN